MMMILRTAGILGFALLLSACGSTDPVVPVGKDLDITTSLTDTTPTLTDIDYSGSDSSLSLNQTGTGTIDDIDEYHYWVYVATATADMTLLLSGPDDSDYDLYINDLDGDNEQSSTGADSSKLIIFRAVAGHEYDISVERWHGEGEYRLTLARPSRDLLGMDDKEYLVLKESVLSEDCDEGGSLNSYTYSDKAYSFMNFAKGYVRSLGGNRMSMEYVNDEAFGFRPRLSEGYNDIWNGSAVEVEERYSGDFVFTFTSSARASARLTGTYRWTMDAIHTSDGATYQERCAGNETGTVYFLL